jgi:hypothetical protein
MVVKAAAGTAGHRGNDGNRREQHAAPTCEVGKPPKEKGRLRGLFGVV